MRSQEVDGKIFVAYHKPFSMLDEDFIVPIFAGKACTKENKDGAISNDLGASMIGDDTGDNISERNNEFNECSVLYWVWKNVDYKNYSYIGLFQYRRQMILNDYFKKAKNDFEKNVYKCVHFPTAKKLCDKIGLKDLKIKELLKEYDCIVPYSTELDKMNVSSAYEDWVRKIPGVHLDDLVRLEELLGEKYPEMKEAFSSYLNSPNKRMYHIFIVKPKVMDDYCTWLFDILFEMDKNVNTEMYSVNGKRTLGYLAEILYGFYFTYMQNKLRIKECGVSFIEK